MALLIVVVVLLTLFQIGNIMQLGNSLLENKQPSRMYLETMKSGVNNSNVMIQSYLLSGDTEFENKNESIWKNKINPARDTLNVLKERWDNASNLILLEKINRLAERIKAAQAQVVNQASFEANVPEVDLFSFEAIQNDTIFEYSELQSWIDEQLNQDTGKTNNGDLFINNLAGISEEYNQISDKLFLAIESEAKELGEEIFATRDRFVVIESIMVVVAIILCFLLFRFVLKTILKSIEKVNQTVRLLGEGNIPESHMQTDDELNKILNEIGHLSDNLKNVQRFSLEVGKGNFDNDISVFNNEGDIGSSLAEMRDSLKTVSEDAVIRNWSNKGFAEFGDILRKYSNNIGSLSDHVITYMVKYLNANQGSIFIVDENEDDKKVLKLRSTYAYDRKKFIDKTIEPGQGMVGQVYLEKQSIYLKEIPHNYITITSGLGKASPNSIFIVPLIVNKEIFGVIEIGSFNQLKDYERDFVEKISENIASSIQAVKVNEQTRKLLDESQEMTEQMRSQEEEMRQNMEELQATQEEMERTQSENSERIKAIENSGLASLEMKADGEMVQADSAFIKLFKFSNGDQIRGLSHNQIVNADDLQTETYKTFWDELTNGKSFSGILKRKTYSGDDVWINATYTPLKNQGGQINKILLFAHDVTSLVLDTKKFQEEKEALLTDIQTLQTKIEESTSTSTEPSESLAELKALQHNLNKELKQKLSKNEDQLKKSLEQQKKKLGL